VYKLYDRNAWLVAALGLFMVGSMSTGITQAVKAATSFGPDTTFRELASTMKSVTLVHLIVRSPLGPLRGGSSCPSQSAATIDVTLSVLIATKLARTRSGFSASTDSMLTRLLIASLTTAAVIAFVVRTFFKMVRLIESTHTGRSYCRLRHHHDAGTHSFSLP
jgi:hypothetical protein